jgi:hypothetical protein
VAYEEFVAEAVGRLTVAAEKIGGKVLDATKLLTEVFAVANARTCSSRPSSSRYGTVALPSSVASNALRV